MKDFTIYSIGLFVFLIAVAATLGLVISKQQYNTQVNKCYETFKSTPKVDLHKLCGVLK